MKSGSKHLAWIVKRKDIYIYITFSTYTVQFVQKAPVCVTCVNSVCLLLMQLARLPGRLRLPKAKARKDMKPHSVLLV